MTSRLLLAEFFDDQMGDYERGRILDVVATDPMGCHTLEFNVTNVRLDFDRGLVTLEDELDATRSEILPLTEFVSEVLKREPPLR